MISAYQTTLNSDQYPHTRAVLIQDAKYQYIRIDPRQGNWLIQQAQPFIQQQKPTGNAPTPAPAPQQIQPAAPAPAPQQTQPAAPAPKQTQPVTPAQQKTKPAPKPAAQPKNNAPATGAVSKYVQQVIDLTNAERSKNGLPALKADSQLNGVAQKKSLDMQQKNYFSHTSPTYGSPFDMMRDFGVTYKSAGENIAQGQRTPQEVVTAWMNSEGHRKNILSSNFTHIGVGFEDTGKHWTQMFIGK
ncbi:MULTISPECIES: CAP domain-containing protein [Bacillaceae]|uniref:CAP domain-containing protein n=1 Tax=Bacillaceae TaxID=186817 RepID=UPI001187B389|nr:SCP-like extracellular protein [Bacillus sp. S3]